MFSAAVTVTNQGTAAGTPGALQIWTNQPGVQGCATVGEQSATLTSLAAGASTTVIFNGLSAGARTYRTPNSLRAFVDSACRTGEPNEADNQLAQTYTVAPAAPDFAVTGVVITPTAVIANSTFDVAVTVKNRGTVDGTPGALQVWSNRTDASACGATGDRSAILPSLAAGASTTLTLTGLPAGAAGAKTLRAFVDSACLTIEPNEPDNQYTKTHTVVPAGADFAVTGVVVTPSGPRANGTFSAAVTVKNRGSLAGVPGTLRVWSNQASGQGCGAIGNAAATLTSLAGGSSRTITVSGLPAGTAGVKTLRAFVDSDCRTAEPNEPDNQYVQTYTVFGRPMADFAVTSIALTPSGPVANGTFSAAVTVKNQGSGSGDGGYLDLWANQPNGQVCGVDGDAFVSVGTLAAGASKTLTLSGLPASVAGAKTLRAFVDSACLTAEPNEADNQYIQTFAVVGRPIPDFVVTAIVLTPSGPRANSTFSAAVTVKNQGSGSADGGYLDLWVNQPAAQPCQANGNAFASVGTLAAGASKTLTVSGLLAGAAGVKTLRAYVDSYCQTSEVSDGNNQTTRSYTVVR
ncbi:CARDB domain-containing protein [uncultured Lamprocystis sp.]|uniref:CARDB domain-containing protein n=1 Tax=uncultured Lamprocystis sp. TaxID=543132 RepID=UPI0025D0718D|nr:CARDB domain-containing protein [uncultured Lamprocystis sp.]